MTRSHSLPTLRSLRALALIALTVAFSLLAAPPAFAADFDPELIISNANMRDADSMSRDEIQDFLATQTGPLASLVTTDHTGVKKRASTIIWQACQEWRISPKVMLAMLQKEQSLLTRTWLAKNTLSRAVGAGCPNGYTNRYPGFGKQVWNGARLLSSYGEGSSACPDYYPGIVRKDIYRDPKVTLHMKNLATYKLYVYNPSIGTYAPYGDISGRSVTGNANFWKIYRRYFGSTFAQPRMRSVYRFRNRDNGTYLYTSSIAEWHKLRKPSYAKNWRYTGRAFTWDTSVPTSLTIPVYRFKNKITKKYSYTTSKTIYNKRRSATGKLTWDYQGKEFRVRRTRSIDCVALHRFRHKTKGSVLLTKSTSTVKRLRSATNRKRWSYEGVVYYLPRVPTLYRKWVPELYQRVETTESVEPTTSTEPTGSVEPTETPGGEGSEEGSPGEV